MRNRIIFLAFFSALSFTAMAETNSFDKTMPGVYCKIKTPKWFRMGRFSDYLLNENHVELQGNFTRDELRKRLRKSIKNDSNREPALDISLSPLINFEDFIAYSKLSPAIDRGYILTSTFVDNTSPEVVGFLEAANNTLQKSYFSAILPAIQKLEMDGKIVVSNTFYNSFIGGNNSYHSALFSADMKQSGILAESITVILSDLENGTFKGDDSGSKRNVTVKDCVHNPLF